MSIRRPVLATVMNLLIVLANPEPKSFCHALPAAMILIMRFTPTRSAVFSMRA